MAAAAAAAGPAAARTLLVPGDAATPSVALASGATAGDTLLVAPGRYPGAIQVPDGVALIALAGPDSTVLDGAGAGPVVTFSGVGPSTLIDGFTITGGLLAGPREDGAGIRCVGHAAPRINHCRVIGNRALGRDARGGGVACLDGSSPVIANNRIEGNEAEHGGGIYIGKRHGWESSPVVSGNRVLRNRARGRGGGIAITHFSEAVLTANIVAWNAAARGGGGVSIERARVRIAESVVWANADSSGLAAGILLDDYAAPVIERTVVARNSGGPGVRCEAQFQEWLEVGCNDVWGHASGEFSPECRVRPGNLSADPLFCDPDAERFELRPKSPCRAALECGRIGAFGVACAGEESP